MVRIERYNFSVGTHLLLGTSSRFDIRGDFPDIPIDVVRITTNALASDFATGESPGFSSVVRKGATLLLLRRLYWPLSSRTGRSLNTSCASLVS